MGIYLAICLILYIVGGILTLMLIYKRYNTLHNYNYLKDFSSEDLLFAIITIIIWPVVLMALDNELFIK